MKRILYFFATVCFMGACVCAYQAATMPDLTGEAIEAVDSHDPSAREDVDAAREQMPQAEAYLRDAGLFLLGFGMLVAIGRRVR